MALGGDKIFLPGFTASGALTQFTWGKMSDTTAGVIVQVSSATDTAIGIIQDDATNGQAVNVALFGVSKAVSGTSVGWAQGVAVGWNSTGRAVPRTTTVTTPPMPFARATYVRYETTIANGDIISVVVGSAPISTIVGA